MMDHEGPWRTTKDHEVVEGPFRTTNFTKDQSGPYKSWYKGPRRSTKGQEGLQRLFMENELMLCVHSIKISSTSAQWLILDCQFFQAEDGIRDRSPSRGLGDVYKRQLMTTNCHKWPLRTNKSHEGPWRTMQDHAGPFRSTKDHEGPWRTMNDQEWPRRAMK